MSRLVMLPKARQVPEFRPLSALPSVGFRRCPYGASGHGDTLRSKGREAEYGGSSGINTGLRPVVQKQRSSSATGHLGRGWGRPGGKSGPTLPGATREGGKRA
jgi:hypothetical protein